MKRILFLSLKIFSVLVFAAVIAAASLLYSKTSHSAGISGKSASPAAIIPVEDGIVVNEVMSSNSKYLTSDGSTSNDWVELFNTTGSDLSLENYALTDNYSKLNKWPFPDISINAHGYLVISLTGDIMSDPGKGIIHCSFKISSNGDSIYLVDPKQNIADYVKVPKIAPDTSYGRVNGEWHSIDYPTPGFENSDKGYADYIKGVSEK